MGQWTSRQNAANGGQEAEIGSQQYKYPPKSGNYFGTHFIMGGERFDTPQPEAYLFGENADLNFLGNRPTPFPYPPPQATEPTKTLKSLVNIRKESVRFVRSPADNGTKIHEDGTGNTPVAPAANKQGTSFNIEFTFDSDAKCAITIYYFCVEDIGPAGLTYIPRDPSLTSETIHMKKGANQFFSHSSHIFNPNLYSDEDLSYNVERDVYPIVVHCVVEEGGDNPESRQSHATICVVDHHTDGSYCLRALKQKIFVDGLCYLLQEIYGIENKNINKCLPDEDTEDNGCECVICMCDVRDTLILPCRHLCLCNSCADSLRYQANNCPICRAPFRALIQIRAVQKTVLGTNGAAAAAQQQAVDGGDNIPDGYMAVSLIEALNGPPAKSQTRTIGAGDVTTPASDKGNKDVDTDSTVAAVAALSKTGRTSPKDKNGATERKTNKDLKNGGGQHNQSTEFRMSVLLSKEDGTGGGGAVTKELLAKHSPLMSRAPASRDKNPREKGALRPQPQLPIRDCLKLVNEKKSPNDDEEDSEAEKLSPLLSKTMPVSKSSATTALTGDGVESIDDTDTDIEEQELEGQKVMHSRTDLTTDGAAMGGAEDSDYYTPEDTQTTILSPLCSEKKNLSDVSKSKENLTPLAAIKETSATSLPDSPLSGNSISTRSSGDSYSSSSSTRQLLVPSGDTVNHEDSMNKQNLHKSLSNTTNA